MASPTGFRYLPVALAALTLAGCALDPSPDTRQLTQTELPNAQPPPAWKAGVNVGVRAGAVQDVWLADFGDPRLLPLVQEALAYNVDLKTAAARVEAAQAALNGVAGGLWPTANLVMRTSGSATGSSGQLGGVLLSGNWELDLWGRIRYGQQAVQDQFASAQADAFYARQSIVANLLVAWFMAAELVQQKALAVEMTTAAQRTQQLAQDRLRVGVGSDVDVAQAGASVQTYKDSEKQIDLALSQARRALELLLGRYPAAEIALPTLLGVSPAPIAAGVPSELLERRPDVTAAALRVSTAFARVGEAKAARLPSISLTAALSSISSSVFVLQDVNNPSLGLGATLIYPMFNGGKLQAQVEFRTAEQKEAAAAFARTAQRAFNEAESALAAEASLTDREPVVRQGLAESRRALELEQVRFRIGSRDMRSVTQLQLAALAAQLPLLRLQTEQRVQRVKLHLALGSQFEPAAPATPTPATPVASR